MSEVEKTLTDAYYWLSIYKSGAITEGVAMEKVKEAIFAQPQLNENQQIVLDYLKEYMLDDSDFYNTIYASKQLYSYGVPYGEESEAFTKLSNRELAQVLELFSKWALEQEEG